MSEFKVGDKVWIEGEVTGTYGDDDSDCDVLTVNYAGSTVEHVYNDAILKPAKKAKVKEPKNFGAVVVDKSGKAYQRSALGTWWSRGDACVSWTDIKKPTVLYEGVKA